MTISFHIHLQTNTTHTIHVHDNCVLEHFGLSSQSLHTFLKIKTFSQNSDSIVGVINSFIIQHKNKREKNFRRSILVVKLSGNYILHSMCHELNQNNFPKTVVCSI